jgi:hypothetical protein
VKKPQRSFTVEYKSGRRKLDSNPNSIWGDVDLKSAVQALQDEAVPLLSETPKHSNTRMSFAGEQETAALLTLPLGQETTGLALQETMMADENNTMTEADTPAVVAPDVPKKERKPRARKAAPETVTTAVSAQPATASTAGNPKRGRKPRSDQGPASAKRAPVKRAPKAAVQAATTPSVAAVDEFADLLQLEEENQRLRKLLAEKLRAENADLRKRLNLG